MQRQHKVGVLFVSHKYPPATGGMEKHSFELISGMPSYADTYAIVYDGSESVLRFFLQLNRRILRMLKIHPHIGLIHYNDGLMAAMALYHKGYDHLKKVVTVHGLDVVFPWRHFQQRILPRFNRFDHIIAVSRATAEALIARGADPQKVSVVPNGIDPEWSAPAEPADSSFTEILSRHDVPTGKDYLVLLGRPVRRKGFSWFIESVLPRLDSRYHLLLIGPFDPLPGRLEKWLQKLPFRWRNLLMLFLGFPSDQSKLRTQLYTPQYMHRVSHLGKLPAPDLQTVLRHVNAFLMPNIPVEGDMEGFGLVCLEASICGTIVYASAIEGITDAIRDRKNGFLIPGADPCAWVQRLNSDVYGTAERRRLQKSFATYTRMHYSWDKMVRGYCAIFEKLCGE